MLEQLFSRDILVWLFPALVTIGAALLGLAALVGIWLIVSPKGFNRISEVANRWYPPDQFAAKMNPQFQWSRFFYRHHIIFGALLAAGAGYALVSWAVNYERHVYLRLVDPAILANSLDWLIAAAEVVFVLLNGAALILAFVVIARPSALKEFEEWSDRWIEGDVSKTLDQSIDLQVSWLQQHPRLAGIVILLICLYIVSSLLGPTQTFYDMLIR